VRFPGHAAATHPTQLYEAGAALAIAAALYLGVRPRKRAHGQAFAALLVFYGVARFLLEYVRADERGSLAGLSTSQWIAIPLVAAGAWLWWRRPR
jgi:phosphatidylglycerol:prolipoprotein diacylglycerol transferase